VACSQLAARLRGIDAPALLALDQVLAQLPAQGRKLLRWRPQVARLAHLGDAAAIAAGRGVLHEVAAVGRTGLEIAACAHLVERLLRTQQHAEADALARRTLALMEERAPDNAYRGDVWLQCLPALLLRDVDGHRRELQRAVAWIEETAARRVPATYRESFLERNPANRELRRAASRQAR
jgi:hypothetical protein